MRYRCEILNHGIDGYEVWLHGRNQGRSGVNKRWLYVSGLDVLGQSPRHNICTFIELPCYLNCLLKLHILC